MTLAWLLTPPLQQQFSLGEDPTSRVGTMACWLPPGGCPRLLLLDAQLLAQDGRGLQGVCEEGWTHCHDTVCAPALSLSERDNPGMRK